MQIAPSIQDMLPELVAWRRDFHRHPELAFEENRTSKIIADLLRGWGFEVHTGIGKTGVVGLWRGEGSDDIPTLAYRADMDALPLQENNVVEYASQYPGKMHACGHDGHMAILLGFARWLSERKERFPGKIKLIFQPAEEGGSGAEAMIRGGVLEDPKVDQLVALHLWNNMEIGTADVRAGPIMASSDPFTLEVIGQGGHGAIPQQTIDAITAAAHIVTGIGTLISRRIDPLDPSVISIGQIHGGSASNIIAEHVAMEGTARTFNPELREKLPQLIKQMATGVAESFGAEIAFKWKPGYPPTVCDPEVAEAMRDVAGQILGEENVLASVKTMGSEDVSYYLERVPGCFLFLGSRSTAKRLDRPHHHPEFDFDEDALPISVAIFARYAEQGISQIIL